MKGEEVIAYWVSGRYRQKPKTLKWLNTNGLLFDGVSSFYRDCTLNIDDAYGDQLDLIGEIIGIPRFEMPTNLVFFGYQTTPGAVGYGIAPYFDPDALETSPILDHYYRQVLKAKTIYNTTDASRLSIIKATRQLFNITNVEVIDNEDMTFSVKLHEEVDAVVVYVLNLYKAYIKPAGVKFLGYQTSASTLIGIL